MFQSAATSVPYRPTANNNSVYHVAIMLEWQRFASVFEAKPDYTLDNKQVDAINRHRKDLGGTLFFDRTLQSVGLKQGQPLFIPCFTEYLHCSVSKSYPPKSNGDLQTLWQKIVECSAPEHQKHALLFYILKDCRQLSNADIEFASQVYLPRRYELVMTGFWELDHCQFSRALQHLTDPSVTPTFADEILTTLIRHPKCDNSLAMAYYLTVNPPLQNKQALEAYFDVLCNASIVEAYRYSQKQTETNHKLLFEKLIQSVHSEAADDTRAERALLLIGLPFDEQEESWFEECLLHGIASKYPGAKDSVLMRRIAVGKHIHDALDRHSGPKLNGLNWNSILSSMEKTAVG